MSLFFQPMISNTMKSIMHLKGFGIQDQNNSDELLLMLDYGIFYEFIPMDTYGLPTQKIVRLAEVEK